MRRLVCSLRTLYETLTWRYFWRGLLNGELVVISGHVYQNQPVWSEPVVGPYGALIEYDITPCVNCGALFGGWRHYWGYR